jgi:hypothetical protein
MRKGPVVTSLLCLALAGGLARHALAADPAEVEELIRKGNELRRQKRDPVALPYFRQAYDLDRSPRTSAQLGLVESALGYWLAAEEHLAEALSSPGHPWLVQHLPLIKETLGSVRQNICELDVLGSPAGAEVLVNGRTVGTLPLARPVRLVAGTVQVTVRAPGYTEASSTVNARGGGSERVTLTLAAASGYAAPGPVSTPAPSAGPAPAPGGYYAPPPADVGLAAGSRPAGWLRPTAWVVSAVALAAAGFGGYEVLQQRSHKQKFDDYVRPGTRDQPCAVLAVGRGGPPCDTYYKDAEAASRLAVVGFVSAGVLAAAGIVAFIVSGDGDDRRASAEARPLIGLAPGGASVGLSVPF